MQKPRAGGEHHRVERPDGEVTLTLDESTLPRREFLALAAGAAAAIAACGSDGAAAPGEHRPVCPGGGACAGDELGVTDAGAVAPDGGEVGADAYRGDDPRALPEAPLDLFPIGISSGDVEPTSAVLHTRYAGAAPLELLVWQEGTTAVTSHAAVASDGGFVHVVATGLSAGAWYAFAFVEQTARRRSPVGRFRAALADDAMTPLIVGASSCTFNFFGPHATLEQAGLRSDLDLFLLLGDTSYNDGCNTVDDYRERWKLNFAKDGYRAIRAKTSLLATWDDHEVGNNWSPETVDAGLLARATQVFFEHLPLRRIPSAPNRLWKRVRWGHTAEFFVLDGRSERVPSTRETPGAVYLSRAQMDWLKAGLADSPAVFKILLNSVPFANFPASFDLGKVLLDPADRWQGYKAAQEELLKFIEETPVKGCVFVSGDFHLACAGKVSASGLGEKTIEVVAGPGNQVVNPLDIFLKPPQWDVAHRQKNYAALHLDPTARTVRVVYHGIDGSVIAEHTYSA